jgi:transcriptional regulator with XRE-family HTH domain
VNNFGKNLRYLREKNKLRQEDMESLLAIKPTTCSNYENGVSEPAIEGLIRISNFFEVSLQELIMEDLKEKDGPHAAPQRNRRTYTAGDPAAKLEETRVEIININKEVKQLRQDVNALIELRKERTLNR